MQTTILIAEDFDDTRELMSIYLQRQGYGVLEARNGAEAVSCARKNVPGLILMDIAMPEMTGIEATREIRNTAGIAEVPIVAITAFSTDYIKEALAAGCDKVISKPVNFEVLKDLLDEYLPQPKTAVP